MKKHRNTEGLSALGKYVIESCPEAYVNELGQVIDPCHVWWSNPGKAETPPSSAGEE